MHEKHAGKSMQEKLEDIRKELRKKKENWGVCLALLDEICCECSASRTRLQLNLYFPFRDSQPPRLRHRLQPRLLRSPRRSNILHLLSYPLCRH